LIPAAAVGAPGVHPADWVSQLWDWMDINIGRAVLNGNLQASRVPLS
jgi:hypothetical protein